ncbi:MAG TPA: PTS IIA-like nitrogen-regulatory protein PtsN [Candidatus Tenderia electrophaga]|uniref:PTS IIA-like nitrogen-regulatory protein PtsN n=1 Tax=Candidatus Tenderia electrophaga TaxID=1748243 RepID=A0A832J642_9GAMM|nr:PTS IIA-like nitrogen-regulatory protein PtsN [Candidatus Tenderia electrophaga]
MEISQLLSAERVVCNVAVSSKKRALEAVSNLLAEVCGTGMSEIEIFDGLIAREKLGSTGLGHGVAIPHGRFKNVTDAAAVFIKFEQGIDFDAIDGGPVDLVFALMVPQESTEEHLQLLGSLAEMFSDASVRERLRQSNSSVEILEIFKDRPSAS